MTAPRPTDRDSNTSDTPSVATYAGAGLQFAAALVIFALGGNWLDKRLDTSPLFILLGVFLGAGGAFYSMYRKLTGPQQGRK